MPETLQLPQVFSDNTKPTLVVIDFSVFLHRLIYGLPPYPTKKPSALIKRKNLNADQLTQYAQDMELYEKALATYNHQKDSYIKAIDTQLLWLLSCQYLEGLIDLSKVIPVIVNDQKNSKHQYWRHDYLKQSEENKIAYKAGRKLPNNDFKRAKRLAKERTLLPAFSHIPSFSVKNYEADDLAATLVHLNRYELNNAFNILLVTVDSDWLGLIDDHTSWFCMHGYKPRVRSSLAQLNHWAKSNRNLLTTFSEPTELWEYKSKLGDKSDNLPANSPIEVINLLNPPDTYKLWLSDNISPIRGFLNACLDQESLDFFYSRQSRLLDNANKAAKFMALKYGVTPVVPRFRPEEFLDIS